MPGTKMRRPPWPSPLLTALALAWSLALVGCAAPPRRGGADTPALVVETGAVSLADGCRIDTTRFVPRRPRTQVQVILAPGFLRDQRHLAGLARALAGQGIPALTLNPCRRGPGDGGPLRQGLDLLAVARELGVDRAVYGGFSAGGLAALVAGRLDPRALGVLTLDLVDRERIGLGMARALSPPLIGLAGSPSRCNAHNNARAIFPAAPRGRLTPIPGASHCDFESPTDWLCQSVCGVDDASARRRQEIIRIAVADLERLIGLPSGPGTRPAGGGERPSKRQQPPSRNRPAGDRGP